MVRFLWLHTGKNYGLWPVYPLWSINFDRIWSPFTFKWYCFFYNFIRLNKDSGSTDGQLYPWIPDDNINIWITMGRGYDVCLLWYGGYPPPEVVLDCVGGGKRCVGGLTKLPGTGSTWPPPPPPCSPDEYVGFEYSIDFEIKLFS